MRDVKQRIKRYRLEAGLKPSAVAREVGVSRGAVYHWEDESSSAMPTVVNLIALSKLFKRTVSEILGQDVELAVEGRQPRGSVPLVTQDEAAQPGFLDDLKIPSTERRYMPCPVAHGPNSFAMTIVGDANQTTGPRSYSAGEVAYFDPDAACEADDMVLAKLPSGKAVVRRLVEDGDDRFLLALNPQYGRTDGPFTVLARLLAAVRAERTRE